MNYRLLLSTILMFCLMGPAYSQGPEITSWMRNVSGHLANYEYYQGNPNNGSTPVQLTDSSDVRSVCYNDNHVYVTANGLASYTMGPFLMNPNEPSNQDYTFKFTRNPSEETGAKRGVPLVGGVGFALNGVILYGYGDARSYSASSNQNEGNGDGQWYADAWVSEGSTMDPTGAGHPDNNGNYHYHATPIALYTDPSTSHSPIIGYALDGYPIYGPFGYSVANDLNSPITRMMSGYELRNITQRNILPDGSNSMPPGPNVSGMFPLGTYIEDYEFTNAGDLDQYNGRVCVTPEYPNGTYAYFLATDNAGEPAFPYILASEYYGVLSQNDVQSAGNSNTPTGLDCYTGETTSVNDLNVEIDISVFPNPTTERVLINTAGIADAITVMDIMGAVVNTYNPQSETLEINTSNYADGLYFVKVDMQNQSKTVSLQVVK